MGGVVRSVKKAVNDVAKETKRATRKAYDITNKLLIKPALMPTRWAKALGNVAIRGKSFKKTLAKELLHIAKALADAYDIVGNKWLGINDDKFLGIKDKNLSRLGKVIKDALHDDAIQTISFVLIAFVTITTWELGEKAGLAIYAAVEAATASTILAVAAGVTTFLAVEIGMSYAMSGLIEAAAIAINGDNIAEALKNHEYIQEALKISYLNDVLMGAIFDKMAGGYLYASQFAGNIYYDATKVGNCNISVGGEFSLSADFIRTNIGFIDLTFKNLAGDDSFSVVNMSLDKNT